MSSTFSCPVVRVNLSRHHNADSLSLVKIGGYQCVVKTEEWRDGQLAVYVPPDSVVPDRPEWEFLGGKRRITARRFRQEWSHGLLTAAPPGLSEGDDAAPVLGISAYESPAERRQGLSARDRRALPLWRRLLLGWREFRGRPRGQFPYYDLENIRKYPDLIGKDEPCYVVEKIHGANACYVAVIPWWLPHPQSILGRVVKPIPKIFIRSRTQWKKPGDGSWWARALENTPTLEKFILNNPGMAVYGEVYGRGVQSLEYGATSPQFVAFDLWDLHKREWLSIDAARSLLNIWSVPLAPCLGIVRGASIPALEEMAEFPSALAEKNKSKKQISEGIVITTVYNPRKILKLKSNSFLEKRIE